NNATVEGRTAYDSVLVDESVNGTDPDLTPDSIPTNDMSPTPVNFDCLLVAQTEVSSVICFGDDDGIATASATGGSGVYTYLWSNSATTQSISGLAPGAYSVTVTDENGCTATANATITQPTEVVTSISGSNNVLCFGENTGSASATA